jgi:hypothetical protein
MGAGNPIVLGIGSRLLGDPAQWGALSAASRGNQPGEGAMGWHFGGDLRAKGAASQSRSSPEGEPAPLSERFQTTTLPALAAGTVSLERGSKALGKSPTNLRQFPSIKDGTYKADRPLFDDMIPEVESTLNKYLEDTRATDDLGFPYDAYMRILAADPPARERLSEGSSNRNELAVIVERALENSAAGGNSGMAARSSPTELPSVSRAAGQGQPGSGRANTPVRIDAPTTAGSMSVTATLQSAPRPPAPLSDREIDIVLEGLTNSVKPLERVSDVALWLNLENEDRVRPYFYDAENQGEVQLKFTDLGKRVLKKKGFDPDSD